MTGFRVARGGAQERYGVRPDLTTLGKIVGGGLPVGAYGGRRDLMERVSPAGPIYQAGTLSGNPLSMAAGLATLDVIAADPQFYARLEAARRGARRGTRRRRWRGSVRRAPIARVGSMWTLFFAPERVDDWTGAARCDTARFARVLPGACSRAGSSWRPRSSKPTSSRRRTRRLISRRRLPRRPRHWRPPVPETEVRAGDAHRHSRAGEDALFLRACRREPVERTPVWIMRQAGRYLPEYRAIRERHDFLKCCRTPELAAEITLQPVARLGVDAAILFSDILVPLPGMGVHVEFNPAPQLAHPIRCAADVASLRVPDAREATPFVLEAVRLIRGQLGGRVPLIGFAGAPFTMATYLVEGGGSKSFAAIKGLLFGDSRTAHRLLGICADTVASYLSEQVKAGAQAAMLFDTWAGLLGPGGRPHASRCRMPGACSRRCARPHRASARGCRSSTTPATPPAGSRRVPEIGADVIGLDWRMGLDAARARVGTERRAPGQPRSDDPARLAVRSSGSVRCGVLRAARGVTGAESDEATGAGRRAHLQPGSRHPAADAARSRAAARRQSCGSSRRSAHERCAVAAVPPALLRRRHARSRRRRFAVGAARAAAPVRPARGRATPRIPPPSSSTTGSGKSEYRERLADAARAAGDPLSLYIHLPFCRERCSFCGCMVIITKKHEVAARYLDFLAREIAMLAERARPAAGASCSTTGAAARRPISRWRRWKPCTARWRSTSTCSPGAEVAIEVDPRVTTHRAAGAAAAARVQPRVVRRAGLHARGAGGSQPHPARGPDAPALRGRPAARVRVDQHRPDLRAAAADARVVRPRGRQRRVDAAGSRGRVLVRPRALDSRQPEAHRPGDAADGGAQAGVVRGRDGAVPGRRLRADRHGPLRAAARRARACLGGAAAPPQLHGLHHEARHRHGGSRRVGHRRRRRRVRAEHEEALHVLRRSRRRAGFPSSAATCSTRTTGCGGRSSPS